VVTASGKAVWVWDAETGQPLIPPLEHKVSVHSASFAPDGRRVVTTSGKTAQVWDAASGKPLTPPLEHKDGVISASFSPDGRRVVTASGKAAQVWDAETGKPLNPPFEHMDEVNSVSFSPDGRRVVTASSDKTARVWDAETGKPLTPPLEHKDWVISASFAPDGRWVATASKDTTARVWDAETGWPLSPPLEHKDPVGSASFFSDGRRVFTTIWRGVTVSNISRATRIWDVSPKDLPNTDMLKLAQFRSGAKIDATASVQRLTPDEWRSLLEELTARYPEESVWSGEAGKKNWHTERYTEAEIAMNSFVMEFHLRQLLRLDPGNAKWKEKLAKVYIMTGNWNGALQVWPKPTANTPLYLEMEFNHAALLVLTDDKVGYSRLCAEVLERPETANKPRDVYLIARMCSLAPGAVIDLTRPVRLAESVVADPRSDASDTHTLGLAHYRAGPLDKAQLEKAFESIRRSMGATRKWSADICNLLVLALVEHRLEHRDKAKELLDQACQWIDQAKPRMQFTQRSPGHPLHPHDWLAMHILRREAEELIRPVRGTPLEQAPPPQPKK
jgi:WD40 repeat protein